MAMGANYNKKMTALKPNLTLMKMLENNDLLDEGKLSYLIDLDKKDPAAITKLLHDSKLNPLDINVDEASSYQPNTYTVGGNEVELDSVLAELRDTSGYDTTIGIIGNKWDESSKVVLMKDPSMIRVINEHVESGVYDKVNAEVEKQRMLGQLNGLSDVEAYKQVGYQMRDQGAFNVQAPATSAPKPKPVKAKAANPKLKNKKRAASGTRSTPGKGKSTDFNPLNMSDADFLAQMDAKFN
jgi:hypothetical protein